MGFSVGVKIGDKRISIISIYDSDIELITEKWHLKRGVSDKIYIEYKNELKKSPEIYDKYLISGKLLIKFKDINIDYLKNIFNATLNYAKNILKEYQK